MDWVGYRKADITIAGDIGFRPEADIEDIQKYNVAITRLLRALHGYAPISLNISS